jgi:predicted HicB family RNase H-like nuclease
MKRFTVRLDDDLHARATAKAEREVRSLNGVIGRLLEKWVAGEVDLKLPKTEEEQPEQE